MIEGFYNFVKKHFTITVLVSVIVYKIFAAVLDSLITPLLFMVIDGKDKLPNMKMTYGNHSCDYGTAFRNIFASFLSLVLIYLIT